MSALSNPSDEQLIDLLQRNDKTAFDTIRSLYRKGLLLAAFHQVHNEQEAERLVNNCLVSFWNRRYKFNKEGFKIGPYLHTCLKNAVSHYYKEIKKYNQLFSQSATPPEIGEEQESFSYQKIMAVLYKTFDILPEKIRKVAIARYEGQTHKEIATTFGISEKTSMRYIDFARKCFIELLYKTP